MRRGEVHARDRAVHQAVVGKPGIAVVLAGAPHGGGVDLPVEVDALSGEVAERARVVAVALRADARRVVERVFADRIVAVLEQRENVAHALAERARDGPAHVADHAPGQAVAVFVPDNITVEVAVPVGIGAVPDVHLHARVRAVAGGGEVGVVHPAAVLRLGIDGVPARAAAPEIIVLEVARALREAVVVELVVDDVVEPEQVLDGHVLVGLCGGAAGGVVDGEEVAVADDARARPVRAVIVVRVQVGGGVVALDEDVVLRGGGAEPAVGGLRVARRAGAAADDLAAARRTVGVDAVAVLAGAQDALDDIAARADQRVVELVVGLRPGHHLPRILQHDAARDQHTFRARGLEPVVVGQGAAAVMGRDGDGDGIGLGEGRARAQRARPHGLSGDEVELAVAQARLEFGAIDADPLERLMQAHVVEPVRAVRLAHECELDAAGRTARERARDVGGPGHGYVLFGEALHAALEHGAIKRGVVLDLDRDEVRGRGAGKRRLGRGGDCGCRAQERAGGHTGQEPGSVVGHVYPFEARVVWAPAQALPSAATKSHSLGRRRATPVKRLSYNHSKPPGRRSPRPGDRRSRPRPSRQGA